MTIKGLNILVTPSNLVGAIKYAFYRTQHLQGAISRVFPALSIRVGRLPFKDDAGGREGLAAGGSGTRPHDWGVGGARALPGDRGSRYGV